jgi:hypothetical protein
MDGGFGDDVGVEAVAEIDGVDVVTDNRLAYRVERTGCHGFRGKRGAPTIPNRCT